MSTVTNIYHPSHTVIDLTGEGPFANNLVRPAVEIIDLTAPEPEVVTENFIPAEIPDYGPEHSEYWVYDARRKGYVCTPCFDFTGEGWESAKHILDGRVVQILKTPSYYNAVEWDEFKKTRFGAKRNSVVVMESDDDDHVSDTDMSSIVADDSFALFESDMSDIDMAIDYGVVFRK